MMGLTSFDFAVVLNECGFAIQGHVMSEKRSSADEMGVFLLSSNHL